MQMMISIFHTGLVETFNFQTAFKLANFLSFWPLKVTPGRAELWGWEERPGGLAPAWILPAGFAGGCWGPACELGSRGAPGGHQLLEKLENWWLLSFSQGWSARSLGGAPAAPQSPPPLSRRLVVPAPHLSPSPLGTAPGTSFSVLASGCPAGWDLSPPSLLGLKA